MCNLIDENYYMFSYHWTTKSYKPFKQNKLTLIACIHSLYPLGRIQSSKQNHESLCNHENDYIIKTWIEFDSKRKKPKKIQLGLQVP
jgi:hypothetical protein